MPLISRHRVMAEELDEVSVVEVYEIASQIGSECEKLIDLYGSNCVENLIKKCIVALEMLEAFAEKNERETSLIQELNDRIAKLESEKAEKAETKRKFEKEIESVEENWRCETRELLSVISRLQKENQRLSDDSSARQSSFELSPSHSSGASDERLLQKLEDETIKQKNEIREKSNEIQDKTSAIEQYKSEIDVQKHQNVEIRKRLKMLQMQIRNLCEERADFLATLQDQNREIITLKRKIGLKEDINETGDIERDESTVPRFTVAELKEILNERNELKNRINDLEEELASLRPVPIKPLEPSSIPPTLHCEPVHDDDLPVQGPLPEEWYRTDDHWKKRPESGIKKFFRKIFPDTDEGSFSKRSLSSLTKIALSASGPHTEIPI